MAEISIRVEGSGDRDAIFAVHRAAFPGLEEAELVDEIRSRGWASLSLVAEVGGEVVGHLLLSPARIIHNSGHLEGLGLAPLSVAPLHQRAGVGSALMEAGLRACRDQGTPFVVLLGDPGYYQKFGFLPASDLSLRDEFGGGAAFQVLPLSAEKLPAEGGVVRYCQAFDRWLPEGSKQDS
ncbi:MAG: N-acetyltransferase [Deltaproteobacteria bacterium]|nr:N-acetyltransferase [Deltaproteobacteria bacterium]